MFEQEFNRGQMIVFLITGTMTCIGLLVAALL